MLDDTSDAVFMTLVDVISIQVPSKFPQNGTVQTNGHVPQSSSHSCTEAAGGIIPWFTQKAFGAKQA